MGRNISFIYSWAISTGSNEPDSTISIGLQRKLVIICSISGASGCSALSNWDGDVFPDLGIDITVDYSLGKSVWFVTRLILRDKKTRNLSYEVPCFLS